ncbi:archaetidylserine decarboxylase [Longirhabdus pacifica]|uniref:archaetidylserine decarboxylase n=1 Tax=Longirhabdus pacifica TaxID=2305227 RepID=UPI001009079E|nr:archaetidylserine decarboxylase [Longirhabdus pacifica]
MKKVYKLLTELSSRKTIAKGVGAFSKSTLSRPFIKHFARTYNINPAEAEHDIHQYRTLNEFFTRKLQSSARPIASDSNVLISPVDAMITAMGKIEDGTLYNVKGQDYTISSLLNESPRTYHYKNGFYFVLYLSPSDYHRIHCPASGKLIEKDHIKGKVYPVHDFAMKNMNQVLSKNERIISYVEHEYGEMCVVKVGAMNVSSIQHVRNVNDTLTTGEELAYFEFGSTVVLLTQHDIFKVDSALHIGSKVKMGEKLGHLHPIKSR